MFVTFGYKSELKDLVSLDAYTGEFVKRKDRSVEHILPHSKGGPSSIRNYLMVCQKENNRRGNMPFDKWLRLNPKYIKNIQNYLNELRGLVVENKDYVKTVLPILNKEAKKVASFRGNKPSINNKLSVYA